MFHAQVLCEELIVKTQRISTIGMCLYMREYIALILSRDYRKAS